MTLNDNNTEFFNNFEEKEQRFLKIILKRKIKDFFNNFKKQTEFLNNFSEKNQFF